MDDDTIPFLLLGGIVVGLLAYSGSRVAGHARDIKREDKAKRDAKREAFAEKREADLREWDRWGIARGVDKRAVSKKRLNAMLAEERAIFEKERKL